MRSYGIINIKKNGISFFTEAIMGFAWVVAGMVAGSLFEYLLHRCLHHKEVKRISRRQVMVRKHARHHVTYSLRHHYCYSEREQLRSSCHLLCNTVVFFLFLCGGCERLAIVSASTWMYNLAHQIGHTESLQRLPVSYFHRVHHRAPGCNFGVSTPFWDICFGTLSPDQKVGHRCVLLLSLVPIAGHWTVFCADKTQRVLASTYKMRQFDRGRPSSAVSASE